MALGGVLVSSLFEIPATEAGGRLVPDRGVRWSSWPTMSPMTTTTARGLRCGMSVESDGRLVNGMGRCVACGVAGGKMSSSSGNDHPLLVTSSRVKLGGFGGRGGSNTLCSISKPKRRYQSLLAAPAKLRSVSYDDHHRGRWSLSVVCAADGSSSGGVSSSGRGSDGDSSAGENVVLVGTSTNQQGQGLPSSQSSVEPGPSTLFAQVSIPQQPDPASLSVAAGTEAAGETQSQQASTSGDAGDKGLGSILSAPIGAVGRVFSGVDDWLGSRERRRLQALEAAANSNPQDAEAQAAYYKELIKKSPSKVVEHFVSHKHAVNDASAMEYFKALAATNTISRYLPGSMEFTELLADIQRRSGDNMANGSPNAGSSLNSTPMGMTPLGLTEKLPLHVSVVKQGAGGRPLQVVQDALATMMMMAAMVGIWVFASATLRKYVNGVSGSVSSPSSVHSSASYAPKEYSKETLPEKSIKTFADVKGCDEAKAELEEVVEYLKNPEKFTRLGGKLPKGILLTGPPGTGKTLLARAVAGEAGVPFFYRAGSEFEEMFVGVGSRRVRALFASAKKKSPCIVFIDEIDAIGGSRKQWESHTRKTLNQLLVEMDGFESNEGIIVLAATNLPETLDAALTRPGRFDRIVAVPNPDVRGRTEILQHYLKDKPLASDVDAEVLARGTAGFSGADLANLVNLAAVKAAMDEANAITNAHLDFAKDKILMGSERRSAVISEETRRLTAYHEGGHTLVALNTRGAKPVHKATVMPRGNSLGMMVQLPDKDETSISRQQLLASLDVCMGGRVAEELIFGPEMVTTGARSDLQKATSIARHMVSECGMSEKLGPVYVERETSAETQRTIDAEVERLLREAYTRVQKLLSKHEADLHKLSKALLEYETLTAEEIRRILASPVTVTPVDVLGVVSGSSGSDDGSNGGSGGAKRRIEERMLV